VTEIASEHWTALGSTASVAVTDPCVLESACRAVESELAAIDLACSRFRNDSELSRLNRLAGRPQTVGALLFEAVAAALRAAALTDGAVDPTIGRALILNGYDCDFARVRSSGAPIVAVHVPGWRSVVVHRARSTVCIPLGVTLDLGATAKALAADRAAAAAAGATGAGVLVNLGGDIAVNGPAPIGGWRVRVTDDHEASADAPGQTVAIESGGLATSSTTVRRWGPDAHHIIDPSTGAPAAGRWRTVSVAAASCVDANTATTAAIVMGERAATWLEARQMPGRLVARDGAVHTVGRWPVDAVAA
jgi:thiamine biosynthesis lipoprotein